MSGRVLSNYACLLSFIISVFVLTGCIYTDEPVPVIVGQLPAMRIPVTRQTVAPPPKPHNQNVSSPWLPPSRVEKGWTAIIIHHSATAKGNAAIFDKWHREDNHWEGVGYHFVVGNGSNSGNGEVEPTFRWRQQKTGAHCGGTPGNWANRDGVGICLVGNFDKTAPTTSQMRSLAELVKFIQERYKIPKSRIYGHGTTPGAGETNCPGRKFSLAKLKQMLDS